MISAGNKGKLHLESVFSHIIQKRFSQMNEDVATDALAFILESNGAARSGFMRILRSLAPELPDLRFKTQQSVDGIRPDLWGFSDGEPRVFVENKFWAGLTKQQPVDYVGKLSDRSQPTALLVIGPAAREQTLWRELSKRLENAGASPKPIPATGVIRFASATAGGTVVGLTSWSSVLTVLAHECADHPRTRADIDQLRALCDAADVDAFTPISPSELTDQRTPAFVLQLGTIVNSVSGMAVTMQAVSLDGLRPQANWNRIGRYLWLGQDPTRRTGAWFGIDFGLWKGNGATPLWLIFNDGDFGRGQVVRPLLEPWAANNGVLSATGNGWIAIALEVPAAVEREEVVRSLAEQIKIIADLLADLPPRSGNQTGVTEPVGGDPG